MFVLGAVIALVIIVAALALFIGNMFYNLALSPSASKGAFASAPHNQIVFDKDEKKVENQLGEMKRWVKEARFEDAFAVSGDGLRLHAYMLPQAGSKWVILCHGYMNHAGNMKHSAFAFSSHGYSVLLPNARGHGKSEGKYIGMGWHERLDLIRWVEFITERNPDAEIILYGVSMGAATVMMASGEALPSNVRVIIEDCGYTSAWEEFSYQMKMIFKLPAFPFLHIASFVAKIRAGYSFKDADAVKQLKKSTTPTLFIHGDADTFVPFEMVKTLYDACNAPKALMVAPGAGHISSAVQMGAPYWEKVFSFANQYMS